MPSMIYSIRHDKVSLGIITLTGILHQEILEKEGFLLPREQDSFLHVSIDTEFGGIVMYRLATIGMVLM